MQQGLRRQRLAVLAALLFSWTGMWAIPWSALLGSILGVMSSIGVLAAWSSAHHVTWMGTGQAVTIIGIFSGFLLGLIFGGLLSFFAVLAGHIVAAAASLACGAVTALVVVAYSATFERVTLRIRGYRRLSRQEVRRIAPLVKEVADAMALDGLPRFAMADNLAPNAWTHMRTIVLTTGLLQVLGDDELTAVLAHELHHWSFGDAVGLRLMWAAALPLALLLNLGSWIGGGNITGVRDSRDEAGIADRSRPRGFFGALGWLIAWAPWVITRFILTPLAASEQRQCEFGADAAASALGLAEAMSSALRKLRVFEGGRSGWERTISATHPPTELRLEALEPPSDDDQTYQESDFTFPRFSELMRVLRSIA